MSPYLRAPQVKRHTHTLNPHDGAGYPGATAPLGQLRYNGRPFGLCLLARQNDEQTLLRFMAAYHDTIMPGGRAVPDLFGAEEDR